MKLKYIIIFNLLFLLQHVNSASFPSRNVLENENLRREKRDFGETLSGMAAGAAGVAASFGDVISQGAAMKDEQDFEAGIPFANIKASQKAGAGFGKAMQDGQESYDDDDDRRRKRSPCSGKRKPTTPEPDSEPVDTERRKRQVRDPDNVRQVGQESRSVIQNFLDTCVDFAKKIGNMFMPSNTNNSNQQETAAMEQRF